MISEELNSSGTVLRRYAAGPAGDEPIVWYEGSGTTTKRYMDQDERGSVTRITDSSGTTVAINSYDEYGIPASTNQGRFGYIGQAWLSEIGLAYYKTRFYSPTLGRFLQTDPIGYADGPNWYNYVGSDPINNVDPSGTSGGEIVVNGLIMLEGGIIASNFSGGFFGQIHPPTPKISQTPPKPQKAPAKPAYCSSRLYKVGDYLNAFGQATKLAGKATVVGGLGAAAIGGIATAPVGGEGAAPGLGVAVLGTRIYGVGGLIATGGSVLKALGGNGESAADIFTDVAGDLMGKASGLSEINEVLADSSTDYAVGLAKGKDSDPCQ